MWKKHGSALLGLILTVALFITGIRLPDYVLAAENDKTSIVKDAKLTISQKEGYNGYKPVTGDISTDKDIQVDISFTAVFNKTLNEGNYIKKGDYVQFDLGEKLKFTGDNASANEVVIPINDKSLNVKICDAIFTKDASGNIKVKFDFSNSDDKVFDKESADWQGEGRTVSGGTMRVSLPLKKDDKVEVKTSQISDLSSYDWYVVRVKSSQPLSAKLFIKVGDSWQWVDSGSQELSEDYKELRFDLSAVDHRDATREVGIEFYKSTDEAGDSEVTIDSIAFVKSLDELVAMKPKELPEAQPSPLPEKEEHTEPNNPEEDHPQPQAKPTDEEGQFAFKGAIQSPISSKKEETNGRSKVSKEAVADDNSTVSKVMVAEGSKFDSQKQGHSKLLPNTGSNPSILAILSGMVFTMLAGFIKVFYKNDKF